MRKYMAVSLAWWHTYKWSTLLTMKLFSCDFIGPWFHHLFPDRSFNVDYLKLPKATTYLTWIRLAYPSFRSKLNESLEKNDLNNRQKTLLTNLKDLCEYFIPVVRIYIYVFT